MTASVLDWKNKKAANLCGVRGLFREIVSLLLDQFASGPDAITRDHMHSGSRRMLTGAE
jgi:hypothetical protein